MFSHIKIWNPLPLSLLRLLLKITKLVTLGALMFVPLPDGHEMMMMQGRPGILQQTMPFSPDSARGTKRV